MPLWITLPDNATNFWVTLPDNVVSFWVTMPEIGIDMDKVLLIVNSDVAISTTVADYYVTARGLNAAHRITKALGTDPVVIGGIDGATPATFYTNVVKPVADYIDANDIECVICSASVPAKTSCIPDPAAMTIATSSCLGAAQFIRDNEGGMVRGRDVGLVAPMISTFGLLRWFNAPGVEVFNTSENSTANNAFLDVRTFQGIIPWGRLGLPKFFPAVPDESYAATVAMIDAAVANDGIGAAGGEVHFGHHDRAPRYITGYQTELARQLAITKGIPEKFYTRTYSADWPIQPGTPDYDYATMMAGNANEVAFGMLGAAIANESVNSAYVDSYTWVPGSWGCEATSNGDYLMASMLKYGACSAVGTIDEPLSNGTPQIDTLFNGLVAGRSMCEAMFLSRIKMPQQCDCWGDPLYAPYKAMT